MLIAEAFTSPEALQRTGPIVPVLVIGASGALRTQALLDMGSSMSSVSLDLLRQIGAEQVGQTTVETVNGESSAGIYEVVITSLGGHALLRGRVLGDHLDPPVQVLIGREVLSQMHFHYDGGTGAWRLSDSTFISILLPLVAVAGAGALGYWLGKRR